MQVVGINYVSFFTGERLNEFWQNVKVLFYLGAPMLIIWIATVYGGDLLKVLLGVFSRGDREDRYDDEDYDRE